MRLLARTTQQPSAANALDRAAEAQAVRPSASLCRAASIHVLLAARQLLFLFLVLCLPARSLVAQTSADDALLERLDGSWVLRGALKGKSTTHDVTAAWILDGRYLQLHERSRETGDKGKPQYEAVILIGIDPATAEYQCLWLDSTGGGGLTTSAFGRGKRSGNSIPFLFRDPDGTISFSNTFSYDAGARAWTWELDNVRKDGTRAPFGRVRLTRR
ncbi:MAG TPA: hypothetical protein VJA66_17345 [Thermoanaerobaculia bacterium]